MSRYYVETKDLNYEAAVGWDGGLLTYFCAVYDLRIGGEEDVDEPVFWVGTHPNEILTVEQLAKIIAQYVDLRPEMMEQLHDDWTPVSYSRFYRWTRPK